MMGKRAIGDGGVFLFTFLNWTSFQYLFVKYAFYEFAYWMENIPWGFTKRATLILLLPLLNTCQTKDLIALIALLRVKDKTQAYITFEIIWAFSRGVNAR
jgi:hypothetical protein